MPSSPARSRQSIPSTLPNPNGDTYTRQSLTGDIGLVANQGGQVSPFIRFGRSYRHPNLEEMFFAGPATVGSIAPNVLGEARDAATTSTPAPSSRPAASRAAPTSS